MSFVGLKKRDRLLTLRDAIFMLKGLKMPDNFSERPCTQCSQNVDVNGPHDRCFELIVSSSFNQPMAVERGRSHELVGYMVGADYVHVLRTLLVRKAVPCILEVPVCC